MFRKKKKIAAMQTRLFNMLKEQPLEIYRTDQCLAMYAPGIEQVVVILGENSSMSEGECLKQLVLATREQHV